MRRWLSWIKRLATDQKNGGSNPSRRTIERKKIIEVSAGCLYQHFKGNLYMIVAVGTHTETGEKFVTYRDVQNNQMWVRPLSMFTDDIERDDYCGPRFRLIRDWDTDYYKCPSGQVG